MSVCLRACVYARDCAVVPWHTTDPPPPRKTSNPLKNSYSCDVFTDLHPRTIAMTVLVIVEMFNALNNISENSSLLVIPPWDNRWLLGAIATSVALHLMILYFKPLAVLFGITGLSRAEWKAVLLLSAPVILVDEGLKLFSRRLAAARRGGGRGVPRSDSGQGLLLPLGSIQVVGPLVGGGGAGGGMRGGEDDKTH